MNTPPGESAFDSNTEKFLPLCLLALQMDRVTASLQYTNPCNTQSASSKTCVFHGMAIFNESSLRKVACGFLNTVIFWCAPVL